MVEKQSKKGSAQVDIRPMIRTLSVARPDGHTIVLDAEITAQQPSLNPMLLSQAVEDGAGQGGLCPLPPPGGFGWTGRGISIRKKDTQCDCFQIFHGFLWDAFPRRWWRFPI